VITVVDRLSQQRCQLAQQEGFRNSQLAVNETGTVRNRYEVINQPEALTSGRDDRASMLSPDSVDMGDRIPLSLQLKGGQDVIDRDKSGPLAQVDVLNYHGTLARTANLDESIGGRHESHQQKNKRG
jgi:hypothetical protein